MHTRKGQHLTRGQHMASIYCATVGDACLSMTIESDALTAMAAQLLPDYAAHVEAEDGGSQGMEERL